MKKMITRIFLVLCLMFTCGIFVDQNVNAVAYHNAGNIKMLQGDSYTIEPEEEVVEWTSSHPGIVSVDENGTIYATVREGKTVTITGEHEDGSCEVYTVNVVLPYITTEAVSIKQNNEYSIGYYPSAYGDDVTISIDDPSIATFSQGYSYIYITGIRGGETVLRVDTELGEFTCDISVESTFKFKKDCYELEREDELELSLPSSFESCVWSNSNPNVADWDNANITSQYQRTLVAKTAGTTTITAENELGEIAQVEITVTVPPMGLDQDYVAVGTSYQWSFDDATLKLNEPYLWEECTYEFADPDIAKLEYDYGQYVTIRALNPGDTTLTVTNKYGETATCDVHVYGRLTQLIFDENPVMVYMGRTYQLSYTVYPESVDTNNRISMVVSPVGQQYFDLTEDGVIIPKAPTGDDWEYSSVIICSEGEEYYECDECIVHVLAPYFNKSSYSLYKKQTLDLKKDFVGAADTLTWSSSNTKVATVDANGKVTAVGAGTATITVNSGGYKVTTTVKVSNPKLSKTSTSLYLGKTTTLKVTGGTGTVKWSSSNKKIATVDSKGKVTTKKAGKVTITASVSGMKLTCKVTVKSPTLKVTKKSLIAKETYTLKLNGGTGKKVWKSSNTKVATVSSKGKVTAKSAGTATISVKVNGKTLKCKVTVKANQKKFSISKDVQDYDYGSPEVMASKIYFSGSTLKADLYVFNNRVFRADKFNWLRFKVYDNNGKLVASQKFTNIKLGISPYDYKKITISFSSKSVKLPKTILNKGAYYTWEYNYQYSY